MAEITDIGHGPSRRYEQARIRMEKGGGDAGLLLVYHEQKALQIRVEQLEGQVELLTGLCEELAKTSQKSQVVNLWDRIKDRLGR